MNVETFEKLFIWKESKDLFVSLCNKFGSVEFKDYFYKNQLLKATLAVSNNIADGYERWYGKWLIRYLSIAKWSIAQVKSMLIAWNDLWYFVEEEYSKFIESVNKTIAWIVWFIKSQNKKNQVKPAFSADRPESEDLNIN